MSTHTTAESPAVQADAAEWTNRLVYQLLMALIIGCTCLLFAEVATFSASLDALTWRAPSESFVTISRIGAALVVLLLAKEVLVALRAGLGLLRPTGPARRIEPETAPLVSVIVPAYNEGHAIEETMRSIMALDYPRLEIVVIDDGSTDDTRAKAERMAASASGTAVRVISQPNSGKWKALNVGIAHSTGELVLCVDADSSIERDALQLMVPHFDRPEIAAVSGQVRVRNQINLVTRLQALEYLISNGSARSAQSESECVLIVPGPLGLFRRSALDHVSRAYYSGGAADAGNAGPFSPHTYAEDFELSVMLCALDYRVIYERRAVSFTRAPSTAQALLSQRYRWIRGSMQVASRYYAERWGARTESRSLGRWMSLSTIGELYITPLAGFLLLATLVWTTMIGDMEGILMLWLLVWAIQALTAALFIRSHGESMALCLLVPLQSIYAVVLLTGVWWHALVDHAASRPMRW